MRILTLNSNLKGVGTYIRCFYFSRELARAGHEVTMVTVSRTSKWRSRSYFKRSWIGEFEQPSGEGPWIRMIEGASLGHRWIPGWGSGPLDVGLRTRETAFGGYDAVYGFEYQPNVSWPVYLTRRFRRYRFFSDWCDWHAGQSNHLGGYKLAHRIDGFFEEKIRFLAEKVTVISKVLLQRALAIGVPPERVIYVAEGVDTEYMQVFPQQETRRKLGLPLDCPIVLSGNDGDLKRVVRVFGILLRESPTARAIILGNVSAEIKALARELGIGDRVVFTGWLSDEDYPRYIGAADICLLALQDGLLNQARFPAKLLDFLSAGKPVVTNDVGEVGPLVKSQAVGWIAEPDDNAVAQTLARLLQHPEQRAEMGERARTLMTREWDWRTRSTEIGKIVQPLAPSLD